LAKWHTGIPKVTQGIGWTNADLGKKKEEAK
jgi:hypothetical protein